ncbi:hypothetical protein VTK26DRAFT_4143 [Humicola hyalothermophila]
MSESMQAHVPRPPRAERTTTSCGECRRRKQKCNQGRPCSNCARRFPQPVCEYKPRRASAAAVQGSQRPAFAVSVLPPAFQGGDDSFDASIAQHLPLPPHSPLGPALIHHDNDALGEALLAQWPHFGAPDPSSSPVLPRQYSWSTDQETIAMCVLGCKEGCTAHSEEVHDAIRMLRGYRSTPSYWASQNLSPGGHAWTMMPAGLPGAGGIPWPVPGPDQDLARLPVAHTMQDAELLSIYVKFLSQFNASLDGKPDATNPYIKFWVPYFIQSGLLVRVAIYTAACFLTDTGHVDRTTAMAHKGHVIKLLEQHIRSQVPTSDEAIAGVIQLIVVEWLWGNIGDIPTHMCGLRNMIKFRGGFRSLGLHGLLSKHIIASDTAIALSSETVPLLRGGSEFEFRDNSQVPLRIALNTPFVSKLARFSSCTDALHIHPAVASILDDIRFLLATVLALPERPSAKDLQKVHSTSAWIHDRISNLPVDSPAARPASAAPSPAPSPGGNPTLGHNNTRLTPETAQDQQPQLDAAGRPHGSRPWRQQKQQTSQRASPQSFISDPVQDETQQRQTPHLSPTPLQSLTPTSPSHNHPNPIIAAAAAPAVPNTATDPLPRPDPVYQAVRLSALLYCRAITRRRAFGAVVAAHELETLWTTAWRVPLATWRSLLGVFGWVLLPLVSLSGGSGGGGSATGHERYVKGMMHICLLQMAMENWEVAAGVMGGMVRLQAWLGGGGGCDAEGGVEGSHRGGEVVEEGRRDQNSVGGKIEAGGSHWWERSGGDGAESRGGENGEAKMKGKEQR